MNKMTWTASIIGLLILGGVIAFSTKLSEPDYLHSHATTTLTDVVTKLPYGKTSLKVGDTAVFEAVSVKLLRVTEDSRCSEGVQCIWAGTLKIELEIASGLGKSTQVLELGKTATTEAEKITFVSVAPYPKSGTAILSSDYVITLDVSLRNPSTLSQGACYVGGCSGEVCSDEQNIASNCIYKPEFACYNKTTTCKRQANGKCGWTQNQALSVCLAKASETN